MTEADRAWSARGAALNDVYGGPTPGFAKLIGSGFLAGFSEGFLPDGLSALEVRGRT